VERNRRGAAQEVAALLKTQADLRERVKELTCLYGIARAAQQPGATLEETLRAIVELLPPAWQYPEAARARLAVDEQVWCSEGFRETAQSQRAQITAGGAERGFVEVVYVEERPAADEGPFLREERSLIDAVARQVGLLLERRRAEEEKERLREQLTHADRLATLGQLAAGVAHELNEPLGNILGFAQLAAKARGLPAAAAADLERIVKASLHARDIIRKLLVFARQSPPKVAPLDLNDLARETLSLFASRLAKAGVALETALAGEPVVIEGDSTQLSQALVNLVVNALQAMPRGGTLRVATALGNGGAALSVEDTGEGMTEEVRKQVFLPFFTTKDIGKGTGLGLSVTHGIVSQHGGTIHVWSEPGKGSRFEIRLPRAGAGREGV